MTTRRNARIYWLMMLVIVALGLPSRTMQAQLPLWYVQYFGDYLWAMLIFLGFALILQKSGTLQVAMVTLAFTYCIEISQLFHPPWLEYLRSIKLFALLLGTLWLARGIGRGSDRTHVVGTLLVAALSLASLYHFNRHADWDIWGVYFVGAYALGVLTYWATNRKQATGWLLLIVVPVVIALLLDYRSRIAIALLVAVALGLARRTGLLETWPRSHLIAVLGQISYSVFLVHFPICLVISGLFSHFVANDPWLNLIGMISAWLASVAAGALFYRFVERQSLRGFWRDRPAPGLRQKS